MKVTGIFSSLRMRWLLLVSGLLLVAAATSLKPLVIKQHAHRLASNTKGSSVDLGKKTQAQPQLATVALLAHKQLSTLLFPQRLSPQQSKNQSIQQSSPNAPTETENSTLEIHVLSPSFNPTFKTTGAGVDLIGVASGVSPVVKVAWTTSHGEKGIATGTSSWRSGRIPLKSGVNEIELIATDFYDNKATTTVTVTRVEHSGEGAFSDDVRTTTLEGVSITYCVVDGMAIFEGDIVLGTVEELEGASKRMAKGGIVKDQTYVWPNGIVPYEIGPTSSSTKNLTDAINYWNNAGVNITLVPSTCSPGTNCIYFQEVSGTCSSPVGMRGGKQTIYLDYGGCGFGGAVHEVGHSLGLFHEQSREDRDEYVEILWQNIEANKEHNFKKYNDQQLCTAYGFGETACGKDTGAYDYDSIMHYQSNAFGIDGLFGRKTTIEQKKPGPTIGQRDHLSDGDKNAIRSLYCGGNKVGEGSSAQQSFIDAFRRNGGKPQVGCPLNAAHVWYNGQTQDFNGGAGGKGAVMKPDGSSFAAWIHGAIWTFYDQRGGPNTTFWDGSKLGYPIDDEKRGYNSSASGSETSYSTCQNGDINFYGTGPRAGQSYIVRGAMLTKWAQACSPLCYAGGPLGMPTGEEVAAARSPLGTTGRYHDFESGQIYWHASGPRQNQAFYTHHGIAAKYKTMGSGSALGFPISDEYTSAGTPRSDFEGGYIYWNGSQAVVVLNNSQTYTINVGASPSVGGSVGGNGTFAAGSPRTVTATANSGYAFVNWTENGNVVSSSASYTFTLNSNRNLVANFTTTVGLLPPPALGSPGTTSAPGSSISTLTPTFTWQPVSGADGYALYVSRFNGSTYDLVFDSQIDVGQPLMGTSYTLPSGRLQDGNQYRWNMSSHNSAGYGSPNVTRNYFYVSLSAQNHTINVSASPVAGGSASGGGTFAAGSSRTVTASANSGYSFANWTENGSVVSTSASYTFTVNTNRTLVANFAQQSGCQSTPIGIGQTLNGSLSTSDCIYPATTKYYDLYSFSGTAGQQISASMDSSAFDTYLYLTNAAGQVLAEDNNSGPGTNSRIVGLSGFFTLPATGTYFLWPTSAANNLTGPYSVSVSQCIFSISSSENTVGPGNGGGSFQMDTSSGCTWSAVSDSTSWLTTSSSGTGDGRVSYSFTANPSTNPRTGRITVGGRVSTITQIGLGGAGSVRFSSASYSANENGGNITITVTRSGGTETGTVQYATSNGSATAGSDYTAASGLLLFGHNEMSKTFVVPLLEDSVVEGNETINLALHNQSMSFTIGNPNTATLTIIDNDVFLPPTANAATAITSNSFNANWSSSTGATGYRLDVSTSNTFSSFVGNYNNLDVGNVTSRSVTGLSPNTTYFYRARAYNSGGTSGNSNTSSITTLGNIPSAPTANAATSVTSTSYTANWNSSSGATGYRLDVSTANTFSSFVSGYNNLNVGNVTNRSVTGLSANTTYFYRVHAYNSVGTSGNSNTSSITTLGNIPSAPSASAATNVTSTSFNANWNSSSGGTGYRLDVSTGSSFGSFVSGYNNLNVGNVLSRSVTGLAANTTYYYRVRAYNSNGTSGNSNTITVATPTTSPSAPTANSATSITSNSLTANWNSSGGAGGYRLDVSTSNLFSSFVTGYNNLDVGNVTSRSVTGLSPNTTYHYRLRAYNSAGTSGNSNIVSATTSGSQPSAIQFSSSNYTINEGASFGTITITRTGPTSSAASVNYATSDSAGLQSCTLVNGRASERCDYVSSISTVTFAVGESSKTFTVSVVDDVSVEGSENLSVTLNSVIGASLGSPSLATVTIIDNDSVTPTTNPIDGVEFFIRQMYRDILNRQPDQTGLQNWINTLANCPNGGFGEPPTSNCDRLHVAAGFFQSDEFINRGYWAFRFYMVSFQQRPSYSQFIPDMAQVGGPKSPAEEEAAKASFAESFVQRSAFTARYGSLSGQALANALTQNAGLPSFTVTGSMTNGQILRAIAERQSSLDRFLVEGTVSILYFGFQRRDPDAVGYQNNLATLNANPNNLRHMIFIFIYSTEYRQRFGPP